MAAANASQHATQRVRARDMMFDPVAQRYRDDHTELQQRKSEERQRLTHLNRAYDISMIREQPFDLLTGRSRLDGLDVDRSERSRASTRRSGGGSERSKRIKAGQYVTEQMQGKPRQRKEDSRVDFNIVSNIGLDMHSGLHPSERRAVASESSRDGRPRLRPANQAREFNLVTNRHFDGHSEKQRLEKEVTLREAAHRLHNTCRFDPVAQKFRDRDEDARLAAWNDAHHLELVEQKVASMPPSLKNNDTTYFNMVTNEVSGDKGADMLAWRDSADAERRERFKARAVFERNKASEEVRATHINQERKLNRVAPERHAPPSHDLISNMQFGTGITDKRWMPAYTRARPTPWQQLKSRTDQPPHETMR